MSLFLIGDGEAGKTSIMHALKSAEKRAHHIRHDHRTVGIEIAEWYPEDVDVRFLIYDLAGQAVYFKTHQLFFFRKALYIFVWKAGNILEDSIQYWLDAIQIVVPGSWMLLIVTHIDEVEEKDLTAMCNQVKGIIRRWLERLERDGTKKIPVFYEDGESIRVNCLSSDSIRKAQFRIVEFAKTSPWYGSESGKNCMNFAEQINRSDSWNGINMLILQQHAVFTTAL